MDVNFVINGKSVQLWRITYVKRFAWNLGQKAKNDPLNYNTYFTFGKSLPDAEKKLRNFIDQEMWTLFRVERIYSLPANLVYVL